MRAAALFAAGSSLGPPSCATPAEPLTALATCAAGKLPSTCPVLLPVRGLRRL